jgi:hypothetical protein
VSVSTLSNAQLLINVHYSEAMPRVSKYKEVARAFTIRSRTRPKETNAETVEEVAHAATDKANATRPKTLTATGEAKQGAAGNAEGSGKRKKAKGTGSKVTEHANSATVDDA